VIAGFATTVAHKAGGVGAAYAMEDGT
jgi:hypothetical protein